MSKHDAARIPGEWILPHLSDGGDSSCVENIPHQLMGMILRHRQFDSLDELTEFCREQGNLRHWLSNECDRILLSDKLVRCLRELGDHGYPETYMPNRIQARFRSRQ